MTVSPSSAATSAQSGQQPPTTPLTVGLHAERVNLSARETRLDSTSHTGFTQPLIGCPAAWRQVSNQDARWSNLLGGISSTSATDIWAVGNSQDASTGHLVNFAEHWDGRFWSAAIVPNPGTDNVLNDVAAVSSGDVWAVGTSMFANQEGTIFHWNGSVWSQIASGVAVSLNDVAAVNSNDVWAVGDGVNPSNALITNIQHWNGTSWSVVPSPSVGVGDNDLFGVAAVASNDVWAVGYSRLTATGPRQSLIEHWDGSLWSVVSSPNLAGDTLTHVAGDSSTSAWAVGYFPGSNGKRQAMTVRWNGTTWTDVALSEPSVYGEYLGGIVEVSPTEYWAVGSYINSTSNINAPLAPFAEMWNGASWSMSFMPTIGSGSNEAFTVAAPISGDVWAAGYFLNSQNLGQNLIENYSGLAAPTGVAASPGDQSASVSWTAPCGDGGSGITSFVVTAHDGCTIQGSTTVAAPATNVNFTGLNNGSPLVFTVAAVNGFGRGPESLASASVIPSGPTVPAWVSACSTRQYTLPGSDGATWQDMDATNLGVSFTPSVDSWAVVSGNVDLWTKDAGFNQDVGVAVSGGMYPTMALQPEAWKESGGFAGTYSPNAAYVQTVIPVIGATPYTARLQWKTNKPDPGTIFAGAGPIGSDFSPTRLTVRLIPQSLATVYRATSSQQYVLSGSDGTTWVDMDDTNLAINFTSPISGSYQMIASGNADLWTADAGYNQDIGVAVSCNPCGPQPYPNSVGQPEFWKESGGFAGTYSPNAAFAQAPIELSDGITYKVRLVWKANRPDPGRIFAGAGPIAARYSPTNMAVIVIPRLTPIASALQYTQFNSDGSFWAQTDPGVLGITYGGGHTYAVSVNTDLWTSVAGYNQDIGILVSGGAYGAGTVVAWKESGGFAGTFSPNAAYLSTVLRLDASTSYTIAVVWKANRPAQSSNAIWIGAGPINSLFSPTRLMVEFLN